MVAAIVISICVMAVVSYAFIRVFAILKDKSAILKDKELLESVTWENRGTKTERSLVLQLLKSGVPAQTIFHDLYILKTNETYSQIDVVVATKAGIIVFEVKELSGWMYGTGTQTNWTQVLNYGEIKNRFYNPILQNNQHINHLRKQSKQFENLPFFSIIVFYGDCTLKDISFIPDDTFLVKPKRVNDVMQIIMEEKGLANYSDKREIVDVFKQAVRNGESKDIQDQHIQNIETMLGKGRIFE